MPVTSPNIQAIHLDSAKDLQNDLGDSPDAWLKTLKQPTWITLTGKDTTRRRAIVTLLHANEPSGLKAIHKLFKRDLEPATNLGIFIASVEAALFPPAFSHRYLPNEMDMNRCFDDTGQSNQHQLARNFVRLLRDFAPEAVIDTHNTSAHSKPFAVVAKDTTAIHQITQMFAKRLVVIGQPMGTLIEQEVGCPIVTVEFGGFLDHNADRLAVTSLEQFIVRNQLFEQEPEKLKVLANPMRLRVSTDTPLHYATTVAEDNAITIYNTIDQMNFHHLDAETSLGWMPESLISHLIAEDTNQQNVATKLFVVENGVLKTKISMTIFMATTDSQIAKNDCLLYLCPEEPI